MEKQESKSNPVDKIYPALIKAGAMFANAQKNKTNTHLKYKYATLSSVWEAISEGLIANNLWIVQTPFNDGENSIGIETKIIHESTQEITSRFSMPVLKRDAQAAGSALTYARRYTLMAILGICNDEDDDDGQKAKDSQERNFNQKPLHPIHNHTAIKEELPVKQIILEDEPQKYGDLDESSQEFKKIIETLKMKKTLKELDDSRKMQGFVSLFEKLNKNAQDTVMLNLNDLKSNLE